MIKIFRTLAFLPLPVLQALGAVMGWLVYACSPTYRRRFKTNTQQAGISPAQARRGVAQAGQLVAELPWVWFRPLPKRLASVAWPDAEVVSQALREGRGLILLTPHLGCFEIVPSVLLAHFDASAGGLTAMYRPAKYPSVDALLSVARDVPGLQLVPTTMAGVRGMLKQLRAGCAIGILPDQVPSFGQGVWAPFFGKPAYTLSLVTRLARQTGCAVVLVSCERLSWGRGYILHATRFGLPLDAGDAACATALNAALEVAIRRHPAQYLWGYARYKSPHGEAPPL